MLQLGGDVNTQREPGPGRMNKRTTPLVTAAFHGHQRIVALLLEAGASHFVDGRRIPLAVAISRRHENLALILSQELGSGDMLLQNTRSEVLQMACTAKLVNLVRYYLERDWGCGGRVDVQDHSIALYRVLQKDASKDDFLKRGLHEEAYQIVLMLLKHGANPDSRIGTKYSQPVAVRTIASRHPDPRVRNLLPKAMPAMGFKESSLLIGRPWISSEDKTSMYQRPHSDTTRSEDRCYVRLWDFLEQWNAETPNPRGEYGIEGTNDEDIISNFLDIGSLGEGGVQGLRRKSESMNPPPLSSYPQLVLAEASVQHDARNYWARLPAQISSRVSATETPSISSTSANLQQAKQLQKPTEGEPFPQLGRPGLNSNDSKENLWGRFLKGEVSSGTSEGQQIFPREEGNNTTLSVRKPLTKTKKWKPLLI